MISIIEGLKITVKDIIHQRRSYRALGKIEITKDLIEDLAESAQLAASCYNNQPWNFVFVYDKSKLKEVFTGLSKSNTWAKEASMIIAVFSKKEDDCIVGKTREYFLFDTGMAVGQMLLRGTELGLVMHAIAGFSQTKVKEILNIPEEMILITLLIVGKKIDDYSNLTEKQIAAEKKRPSRKKLEEFIHIDEIT